MPPEQGDEDKKLWNDRRIARSTNPFAKSWKDVGQVSSPVDPRASLAHVVKNPTARGSALENFDSGRRLSRHLHNNRHSCHSKRVLKQMLPVAVPAMESVQRKRRSSNPWSEGETETPARRARYRGTSKMNN
eukprot:Amastigsp_a175026_173.p2 type:complete len:132 gc:universal Amastigsp_a175026_173:418-813(+)